VHSIQPRTPPFDIFIGSQVFPSHMTRERAVSKMSALATLKEKRAAKRRAAESRNAGNGG